MIGHGPTLQKGKWWSQWHNWAVSSGLQLPASSLLAAAHVPPPPFTATVAAATTPSRVSHEQGAQVGVVAAAAPRLPTAVAAAVKRRNRATTPSRESRTQGDQADVVAAAPRRVRVLPTTWGREREAVSGLGEREV